MNAISLISLIISVLAVVSYVPVAKVPRLRRNMWPTWMLFFASIAIASIPLVHGKDAPHLDAFQVSTYALFVLYVISYFLILRVPRQTGRPQVGSTVPHFTLIDENGAKISADDFVGKGPLLLVFFRGFW